MKLFKKLMGMIKKSAGIALFLILFWVVRSYGVIETYPSNVLTGSDVNTYSTISLLPLLYASDQYVPAEVAGSRKVARSIGKVTFGIDHYSNFYYANYGLTVSLRITSIDKYFNGSTYFVNLTLEHKPLGTPSYCDVDMFTLEGSHRVLVEIAGFVDGTGTPITNPANVPKNIYLSAEVEVERYYFLALTAPASLGNIELLPCNTSSTVPNELLINWAYTLGAEEYELEWTYVNDYQNTGSTPIPDNQLNFSFRNNATRVTIGSTSYIISLVYERGYIIYRVRGVGRDLNNLSNVVYTNWTIDNSAYTVSSTNANHRYYIPAGEEHEKIKNWQYSASFAEEGLKKEVVTYFDGSLRNRQAVTKSNTENQTLVGETIYDHQGRPAVQVLPVPTGLCEIKYYNDFNRKDSTGTPPYNRKDFDKDVAASQCSTTTKGMSTTKGASQYYSSINPDFSGFQSYVPDANLYPFTQTEYTPDNTGRIRRQSGAGEDHQLGTGHETQYFYGQPEQVELDRLFGSEAGHFNHYKKNLVVDANGQVSVSYLDAKGKVIATALAGDPPLNVNSMSPPSNTLNVDYLKANDPDFPNTNRYENEGLDIIFEKELLVAGSTPIVYTFDYDVEIPQYTNTCLPSNICYDCVYSLTISVTDQCGDQVLSTAPVPVTVSYVSADAAPYNNTCGSSLVFNLPGSVVPLTASLKTGTYKIVKTLSIDPNAISFYAQDYLQNDSCLLDSADFADWAFSQVDSNDCHISCSECIQSLPTLNDFIAAGGESLAYAPQYAIWVQECNSACEPPNLCEAFYEMMLADMRPGGQYAKYEPINTDDGFTSNDPLSIFNKYNRLPKNILKLFNPSSTSIHHAWWRILPSGVDYQNEDGSVSKILVVPTGDPNEPYSPSVELNATVHTNSDGTEYIFPEDLDLTSDFIDYYAANPWWAKALVQYHPEYIYYEWCSKNSNSAYSATVNCGAMTSDAFDAFLMTINTFVACTSSTPQLMDPTSASTIADPEDLFRLDPYFQNSGTTPCSTGATAGQGGSTSTRTRMTNVLNNYHGSGDDIKELVARTVNCGTVYYPSAPTANPSTSVNCNVFGNSASNRDQEWLLYRNFYITEKRKIQQEDADIYAKDSNPHDPSTTPAPGSYNGCIGNSSYNFWSHGMFRFGGPHTFNGQLYNYLSAWGQFTGNYFTSGFGLLDPEQPCGFVTYGLYSNKVRRFTNKLRELTGTEQQQLDQLQNESDYNAFLQTGQCPSALELQFLLDKLARNSKLVNNPNPENLFNHPEFTQNLYQQISSAASFIQYFWDASSTTNTLTVNFRENATNGTIDDCALSLTCSTCSTSTINWANIKAFTRIQFTNESPANTFNFKIVAWVVNTSVPAGLEPIVLDGSTCVELDDCSFTNVCPPSLVALEFQNLFNLLLSSVASGNTGPHDFTPSSGITLSTSSTNLYSTVLTSRILQPFSTTATTFTWNDPTTTTRTLYDGVSTTLTFTFAFVSSGPGMADIQYFQSVRADANDPLKFRIDAYCGTTHGMQEMTVTLPSPQIYDFGACGLPAQADCNTPNHQLAFDIEDLLDAVAQRPDSGFRDNNLTLSTFAQYTNVLASYLGNLSRWNFTDSTSTANSTNCAPCTTCYHHVFNAVIETNVCIPFITAQLDSCWVPACTVTFKYCSSSQYSRFGLINRITDFEVNTANSTAGYFYEFTCRAYLPDGSSFIMQGSTSCLPLLDCIPCMQVNYASTPLTFCDFNGDTYGTGSVRNLVTIPNFTCDQDECVEVITPYANPGCNEQQFNIGMDHTNPGTGNLLLANYGCNTCTTTVNSEILWQKSLSVSAGTDYAFSFWYMTPDNIRSVGAFDIGVSINGQLLKTVIIPESQYPIVINNGSGIWHYVEVFWNSGTVSTSVNFDIDVTSYVGTGVTGQVIDRFLCLDDITAIEIEIEHCLDSIPPPVIIPEIPYVNPCIEHLMNLAAENARQAWYSYNDSVIYAFTEAMKEKCREAAENFGQSHTNREHHFTLYYYDQAGNLVRTIPPEGVSIVTASADFTQIKHDRATAAHTYLTQHRLPTTYQYNSLNQLINQATPDNTNLALWNWQNSSGVDNAFIANGIEFTDGCNGLMVGSASSVGQVYATNDCGLTWAPVTSIGIDDLKKIQMITSSRGYAIGKDGLIVNTANSGSTWNVMSAAPVSTIEQLNDLFFYNDGTGDHGIIVGNNGVVLIYHYNGSPNQWTSSQIPGYDITGIYFEGTPASAPAYVTVKNATSGGIYKSTDFGSTWAVVLDIAPDELLCIEMQTEFVGFAGGKKGGLYKTTDGAQTWLMLPFPKAEDIVELHFNSPNSGCVILGNGEIWHTADVANGTWSRKYDPAANSNKLVKAMSFYDSNYAYAVGGVPNTSSLILTTTDGGQNWSVPANLPTIPDDITAVHFTLDASNNRIHGFISVDNSNKSIYHYHFNGSSYVWTEYTNSSGFVFSKLQFPVPTASTPEGSGISSGTLKTITLTSTYSAATVSAISNSKDFSFVNATYGYCINSSGNFVTSTDGGILWSGLQTTSGISNTAVHDFSARSLNTKLFAVGLNTTDNSGKIYYAPVTASTAWLDKSDKVTPLGLNDIHIPAATAFYAAGVNGTVLKKSPAATYWRILRKYDVDDLNAIKFKDASNGIVVGGVSSGNGKYATTGNGGDTWTGATMTSSSEFTDISEYETANSLYYISGKGGKVYQSGGTSVVAYSPQPTSITVDLNGICLYTTANRPFAVGNDGTILSYNGTSWVNPVSVVNPPNFISLSMANSLDGIAITGTGVYSTINGGLDFGTACTSLTATLTDVFCFKPSTLKGFITATNGKLYELGSNCSTWTALTGAPFTGLSTDLNHVFFDKTTNYDYGYVVGDAAKIFWNDNFGNAADWNAASNIPSGFTDDLNSVYFVGSVGYAVGDNGAILKSIDYGDTWTELLSGSQDWLTALSVSCTTLYDVYFRDQMTGYAVGCAGTMIKTTDGGVTWTLRSVSATGDIFAINFSSTYGGAAGGNSEAVSITDYTDLFATQFWYDELGRMVVSQNAKQANKTTPAYSYTRYDVLGRINEVGEVATTSNVRLLVNNTHGIVDYGTSASDAGSYQWWLSGGTRKEVTQTTYDLPTLTSLTGFAQSNLRGRVAGFTINEDGTGAYDHATHYTYDIHGNVKTLVQENQNTGFSTQRYKRTDYDYDLISGKVKEVAYQRGFADRFYHRYDYDADNRIIRAYTSKDNMLWDKDAAYFYYRHGPLARVETGELRVQGVDYVYTMQGWIKGVNSNTLDKTRDPGKDATTGTLYTSYPSNIHSRIATDVFGYSLGYYDATTTGANYNGYHNNNDYAAVNAAVVTTSSNNFVASIAALGSVYNTDTDNPATDAPNLYNGNIKHMVTAIMPDVGGSFVIKPLLTAYRYDQLNRIREMRAFADISSNAWGTSSHADLYKNSFTYDANGNILTLVRYDNDATPDKFDDLTYRYDLSNTGTTLRSNKLYHLDDAGTVALASPLDLQDQGTFIPATPNNLNLINTNNNYKYDEMGNLIKDTYEQILDIEWTAYGKIKKITRNSLSSTNSPDLEFAYDAMGKRIMKIMKPRVSGVLSASTAWEYTYYVRDAQGNILATYTDKPSDTNFYLDEQNIYGSSRLGIFIRDVNMTPSGTPLMCAGCPVLYKNIRGKKNYEMTNHLGNVLTTISDSREAVPVSAQVDYFKPVITNVSDYYPFGMQMPGRLYTSADYRFGFNGKENDNEVKGNGNSLDFGGRIYDSRVGRWMSVDPEVSKFPSFSPYNSFNNNPIFVVDKDGHGGEGSVQGNEFVVNIHIMFYGDVTDQRPELAQVVTDNLNQQLNAVCTQIMIGDRNLDVRFVVTSEVVTFADAVKAAQDNRGDKFDPKLNFARIMDTQLENSATAGAKNLDPFDNRTWSDGAIGGDNSFRLKLSDVVPGSTKATHEIMSHGLIGRSVGSHDKGPLNSDQLPNIQMTGGGVGHGGTDVTNANPIFTEQYNGSPSLKRDTRMVLQTNVDKMDLRKSKNGNYQVGGATNTLFDSNAKQVDPNKKPK